MKNTIFISTIKKNIVFSCLYLFIYLYKKMIIIIRMKHEMMILDILNILKDVDDENKFLYYYKHIKLL